MSNSYTLIKGSVPLLISMPHNGEEIPADIAAVMTDKGREVADTDWYMDRLYAFAQQLGAFILIPKYNRYVIPNFALPRHLIYRLYTKRERHQMLRKLTRVLQAIGNLIIKR